jgi:iron(III) transport system permease protein
MFVAKQKLDIAKLWWGAIAFVIASLVLVPIGAIIYLGVVGTGGESSASSTQWGSFSTFLDLSKTTLALMLGTGLGALVMGTGTAWLIASFQFRGRGVLALLLVLPLALPAYISAYVYVELLSYGGGAQTFLRELFGWQSSSDYYFPDLHSLGGAIFILSLALYPYIYIASLGVFIRRTSSLMRAGRVLGLGEVGSFFKVVLPLARPTLFAVLMLVFMECLNDIGVVEYLGVRTLTLGLYDIWLNRNNLEGAVQIALWMMFFAFGLIVLERLARRNQLYTPPPSGLDSGKKVEGKKHGLIVICCLLPPLLGFILPMVTLGYLSLGQASNGFMLDILKFWSYVRYTLALAVGATVIIIAGGLMLAYASRIGSSRLLSYFSQLSVMGYALPGVVLGLGIILIAARFQPDFSYMFLTGYKLLLFAYFIRFLALPYSVITGGLERIGPNLDRVARSLGLKTSEIFGKVHLPLIRPAIWGAFVFVFVEVMRELPLTLIVRSFNFETLATHIYTLASLGLLEEVALAAFFLGLMGLLPAYIWARALGRGDRVRGFL